MTRAEITYRRDADGAIWADVPEGVEVQRGMEVAAWYDRLTLDAGSYAVEPVTIGHKPTADGERPYYGRTRIPARIVETHTPSLWGGVPTGGGSIHETRDDPTTFTLAPYWHSVEGALPHAFEPMAHDAEICDRCCRPREHHESELSDRAAELGAEQGTAAGSWVVDGNSSTDTLRAIIRASDEGEFWHEVGGYVVAPLSGEFADGWTPRDLAAALETDEDADELNDLCTAFEDGFYAAFEDEAVRSAVAMLPDEDEDEDR